MSKVLDGINNLSLIEKLDGEDRRFDNMVKATSLLVERLEKDEALLIAFILTSIDQTPNDNDIAIEIADECFKEVWKSARSIYIDTPFLLYRSMLLDACQQVALKDKRFAYILWNTIADILPYKRFGAEREVFESVFTQWAKESEEFTSLKLLENGKGNKIPFPRKLPKFELSTELEDIHDFQTMYTKLSEDFTSRESLYQIQYQKFEQYKEAINENIRSNENLKLETIWWSKALYSPSLNQSYREFEGKIALIIMVSDLLSLVENAPPASVSYLLSETVANLTDIDIEDKLTLKEIWTYYSSSADKLPTEISSPLTEALYDSWTFSDFVVMALKGSSISEAEAITKLGIDQDTRISLPSLAQAIFREESAKHQVRT